MAENTEEVEKKEEPKQEEHKPGSWEDRALSMGWNPDKYDKDDENFIDAKEFVRRKPLFDKIDSTTKRLRNVEETLTQLASHHQKVKEVEYQRALKNLRLEKRTALKEGDTVTALELEDKMDEMTETHQQEVAESRQQAPQAQVASTEFTTWVQRNDWYLKNTDMHDFADGAAAAYIKRTEKEGKVITEQEVFQHVVDKVKKAYPENFGNPNRDRPSTVNSGDRGGKVVKQTYKPTEEERMIAKNFVKQGIFEKEDDYYKERQSLEGDE